MHSRQRAVMLALACLVACAPVAGAQRPDTARVAPRTPTKVDTSVAPAPKPPLSPRRAFLYSLAVPGYSQAVLGRPTAGALFVLTESIGIAMLREANAELRQARQLQADSILTLGRDPTGPANGPAITTPAPYGQELIDIRRSHREDWVFFLVFNHLFAGAEAYVAAHLWDLPSQLSVRTTDKGTVVAARLTW